MNFHRNVARAECLDDADRMGLLRYTEPGGGMTLFSNKQDTGDPFQRYMTDKIVHMVPKDSVTTLPKYDEMVRAQDKYSATNNTRPESSVVKTISE